MYVETTPPPTESATFNDTCRVTTASVRLSPSGKGDNCLGVWTNIVATLPMNNRTEGALLTNVLTHTFDEGVNNVLQMVKQVHDNYGLLELDTTTSVDGAQVSPYRSAVVRMKNIWARSKGDTLMTVETMIYYKELAEDFVRLEEDSYHPETRTGKDWLEYSKGRTESLQAIHIRPGHKGDQEDCQEDE